LVASHHAGGAARVYAAAILIVATRMAADASHAGVPHDDDVREILSSSLFEPAYYVAQQKPADRRRSAFEAAAHFHVNGWKAYCDPGPNFSTADYLLNNPDVLAAELDPLLHYLRYGRAEERRISAPPSRPGKPVRRARPQIPSDADWERLATRYTCETGVAAKVDVVIPVFKGIAETLRCLYSVLKTSGATPFRLVVVDDHGPEAEIIERLDWLAARDMIQLVRTPVNSGFVRACNLGLGLNRDRDVVLLNADTEVFGNWLDRLISAAYHDETIGTVTPFSNNAEICSYPFLCKDNPFVLEVEDADLDALMAEVNAGATLDIPTGVGFCLFIRRACLDAVGCLDAETFGAGYGEENDFCRRATMAGWRNVLAANVFVRHYGGSSFGASKAARVAAAIAVVERKHPGYLEEIARFIAADCVAPLRAKIDAARMQRRFGRRSTMLFVSHTRGGGTERHLTEMSSLLEIFDRPVLIARPDRESPHVLRICDPQLRFQPNDLKLDLREDPACFALALKELRVAHLHIHHLAGLDESAGDYLRLACAGADIAYDFTAHDYLAICPRITLTDEEGFYCGEPDADGCADCLRRHGSEFGEPAIWNWRQSYGRLLRGARHVFVPAEDVGRRLARYYPDVAFQTRPHLSDARPMRYTPVAKDKRSVTRHVGLVGAIGPHKGVAFLLRCVQRAAERKLALRFTLIGFTDRDAAFGECPNIKIEGAYLDGELRHRLLALAPDLLWFSALWPETFSYTLSAAFAAGIMPVAFDFGAIAERIRRSGFGHVLPVDYMFDVDRMLDALLAVDPSGSLVPPSDVPVTYRAPLQSYYGLAAADTSHAASESAA
jgi:GT2 family glycosyltransferase/glycosyltransferase involved in cell wall biosynthesis